MNSKWIYFTSILFGASSLLLSFFAYSVVFAFLSIPGIILSLRLRKWNRSAAVVAFSINAIAFTRLLYVILLVNIASMNASKVVHQYYFPKEQTGCFELLFNVDGQDSITTEWQLKKNIIKIFIPPQEHSKLVLRLIY